MGPIFETFATGIFKAVRLISDAVADMGLQNLINVLITGFVELNPVIGAMLALVANLPGVIKAITPAVEGLVPVFRKVGEVAGKVFEAALGFVTGVLVPSTSTASPRRSEPSSTRSERRSTPSPRSLPSWQSVRAHRRQRPGGARPARSVGRVPARRVHQ